MKIEINRSQKKDIKEHLEGCENSFVFSLSSIVDLDEYADKLHGKSIRIEIWQAHKLIGLLAFYNKGNKSGYISNVSILPKYYNKGIGQVLLDKCINYLNDLSINKLELEVNKNNIKAFKFYIKNNFIIDKSTQTSHYMYRLI